MIMFKLLLIPIFIVFVLLLAWGVKKGWQVADALEVDEKKGDIDRKADLVDDVESYTLHNKGKMRKASSDTVEEFKNS